jgi:hypothetical protein
MSHHAGDKRVEVAARKQKARQAGSLRGLDIRRPVADH